MKLYVFELISSNGVLTIYALHTDKLKQVEPIKKGELFAHFNPFKILSPSLFLKKNKIK